MKSNYKTKSASYLINYLFLLILFSSCKSGFPPTNPPAVTIDCSKCKDSNNLNISILLDLSDRIDTTKYPNASMQFYQQDVSNIETILKAFTNNILCKKTMLVNDKIKVFIEPVPPVGNISVDLAKTGKVFTRNNTDTASVKSFEIDFMKSINNIYSEALKAGHFVGADIHNFILKDTYSKCYDSTRNNILVIFTDGYLYHKSSTKAPVGNRYNNLVPESSKGLGLNGSDWQTKFNNGDFGFYVDSANLSNFKVIVIGLNSYAGGPYELDFLKENWMKFLDELNIKKADQLILKAELPVNIQDQISNFIYQ